jgi:hypothetical protein
MSAVSTHVNTPLVITIALVTTILLVSTILAMQGWLWHEVDAVTRATVLERQDPALAKLNAAQEAQLVGDSAYRVINKEAGVYAIPIDVAMDLVLEKNGR